MCDCKPGVSHQGELGGAYKRVERTVEVQRAPTPLCSANTPAARGVDRTREGNSPAPWCSVRQLAVAQHAPEELRSTWSCAAERRCGRGAAMSSVCSVAARASRRHCPLLRAEQSTPWWYCELCCAQTSSTAGLSSSTMSARRFCYTQ